MDAIHMPTCARIIRNLSPEAIPEGGETSASQTMEWMTIDSAPKDGTEIIVLIRPKVIRLGWYFAPSSRTFGWCDENGKRIKPTHWTWMPLPSPPEPKS